MNQQFVFEAKQKTTLIGLMILGAVCLGLTYTEYFGGDYAHMRFWTNYLHNTVFFLGIGFLATFVMACKILAYSGWHTTFKRIIEAMTMYLPIGLALLGVVIVGIFLHWHHLYHWADAEAVANDELLQAKAPFLNKWWYTLGSFIIVGMWIAFAYGFRRLSLREDKEGNDDNFSLHRKSRVLAAVFLPLGGFSSAAMIWLWIMSIDAHWYSTMFAWYTTASWLVSCIAIIILMIIYLKSKGYLEQVTHEHVHDLGKYLFGFSVFWTYLWFSQYMLIWYSNVGEETVYFRERIRDYPVLFYGNLIINFVLPFLILMRNETKRKFGTVGFASALVLFGHWFDFFNMIKPGALLAAKEHALHHGGDKGHDAGGHDAHGSLIENGEAYVQLTGGGHEGHGEGMSHADLIHSTDFQMGFDIPGLLELGTFIGFGALFVYVVFTALAKANLIPINDPYIEESLHHEVWHDPHGDHSDGHH